MTALYNTSNPTVIVFVWIISIIGDIVDSLIKVKFSYRSYQANLEKIKEKHPEMFDRY